MTKLQKIITTGCGSEWVVGGGGKMCDLVSKIETSTPVWYGTKRNLSWGNSLRYVISITALPYQFITFGAWMMIMAVIKAI